MSRQRPALEAAVPEAARPRHAHLRPGRLGRPGRATLAWATRQVRRGTLLLAVSAGGYLAMEVATYSSTYPRGVAEDQFAMFVDNPAARMLQGVPHGLGTAGGFAVWDGGWVLQIVVAVWALLVTSRLLRGEEESGRAELLLVGPAHALRVVALTLLVVLGGGALTGVAVTVALAGSGEDPGSSVLFGLGLAGFAATFVGIAAVTSQLVGVRRRAAGLAAAVLGAAFLLRMLANSTDDRAWVGWLTPFGWLDHLQPFGDPVPAALVVLLVAPVVLLAVALWLRGRRDTGGALLVGEDSRPPHLRGLGGPLVFAWRSNRAVLAGWVVGLAAYAFLVGSLLTVMTDFLAHDRDYRRVLAELDLGVAVSVDGFFGLMSVTLGVGFALYAGWRIGAVRGEEESGRADNLLVRPLTRTTWLGGHVLLTVAGATLLAVLTGVALWAGAVVTGSRDVALGPALGAVLNTVPLVLLVTGLAVLAFGVAPRLTAAVPVAVTVGGYVLTLLGPALAWPSWVVDLSPFTHLAYVPAEPFAAGAAAVMALLGVLAAGAGWAGFVRRDTTGA